MKRFFLLLMMVAVMGAYGCQAGSNDQAADAESAGDQAAMVEDSQPKSQVEKVKPQEVSKDESKEEKKVENPIVERSLRKDPGPAAEMARMKTNHGDIVIRFYPKQAPLAVANFKGLAAKGYYDGVTFHRVIKNFMIQGGDPTASGRGGQSIWGGKFKDEFDPTLRFDRPGILAMANAGPATNGSQFFITEVPTPHLNDRHTIFGEVAEGFDVVQEICAVQVKPGDKPVEPVVIEGIEIYTP